MKTYFITIACITTLAVPINAQSLKHGVVGNGGGAVTAGNSHQLHSTIGQQTAIGIATAGNSHQLRSGFWYILVETSGSGNEALADIKIFLQGPFDAGSMSTALKTEGVIPLNQPYNTAPWNYAGAEAVTAIPADVVDWILVCLYSGNPASPPMNEEACRAGLLKNDGTIIDPASEGLLAFTGVTAGNYYLAIQHRVHLGVLSKTQATVGGSPSLYDFTDAATKAYGDDLMQLATGPDIYGMYGGDANADGEVRYIGAGRDQSEIITLLGTSNLADINGPIYHKADMNMNAEVRYIGAGRDQAVIINVLGTSNLADIKATNLPQAN